MVKKVMVRAEGVGEGDWGRAEEVGRKGRAGGGMKVVKKVVVGAEGVGEGDWGMRKQGQRVQGVRLGDALPDFQAFARAPFPVALPFSSVSRRRYAP